MFDLKNWITAALGVLEPVLLDVLTIHKNASTETQTQLATEALLDAKNVGEAVAPQYQQDIDAAAAIAQQLITNRQAAPVTAAQPDADKIANANTTAAADPNAGATAENNQADPTGQKAKDLPGREQ